jgi:hypothetical protein
MCVQRGLTRPATIADHIRDHHGDFNEFLTGALQSLCKPCHDSLKRRQDLRGYSDEIDERGWPIDPAHPANRTR